ncbi:MAG: hypothetical protein IJX37_08945 [Oscillospiraceae bacterium]|nr:hypothetical protein [Oscillospiraceae bacterium]
MTVTVEKPKIITLLYRQEKSDPDYGSCLWARFYLDTQNYTMSIESDCGNYSYGWVPTPDSESFLHLLARMDTDYLLRKISSESVIDGEATAAEMLELIKETAASELVNLDEWDLQQISDACYHHNDERDLVDAVLDAVIPTAVRKALECDSYSLYEAVVKDFPAGAKKIVEVFKICIVPAIKKLEAENYA